MKKFKFVVSTSALAMLVFSAASYSLPSTKYTNSCKLLAPKEGKYEADKVPPITSESAFKKITAANEAFADDKYNESIVILKDLVANASDKAVVGKAELLLGINYRALDRTDVAVKHFEKALSSKVLGIRNELSLRLSLAQISAMSQDYKKALSWMDSYFKEVINPPASSYATLANIYYRLEDHKATICPAYIALKEGSKSKKGLYSFLFGSHYRLDDMAGAEVIGKEMVELFPKEKSYINNLFNVFQRRNKQNDMLALAELAYSNGLWNKESNYKQLAALYSNKKIPLLAGERLKEGLDKGIVESTESNWENVGNYYRYSKEYEKAVSAYLKAAQFVKNGKYNYDIASMYFNQDQFNKAIEQYKVAISKGGLRKGDVGWAYLQMGVAQFRAGQQDTAIATLNKAKAHKNVSKNAGQYINYIGQLKAMKLANAK